MSTNDNASTDAYAEVELQALRSAIAILFERGDLYIDACWECDGEGRVEAHMNSKSTTGVDTCPLCKGSGQTIRQWA